MSPFIRSCFLLIASCLSFCQIIMGQGASSAYIVDEGFTGSVAAVNSGFTLTGVTAITSTGNFGRNSPSLKFSAATDKLEYNWSASGTVADHVSFLCGGDGGAAGTFTVKESANGTTWTTVGTIATSTTASTFDGPLLSTSRYVEVLYATGGNNGLLDDFRIRKAGVAPSKSMSIFYELINAGSGTSCGTCEGYNEFVFFETGSDALDIHYLELVNPTMTYGAGDLAMGGNGTTSTAPGTNNNNNTNINWILNANLTATQTNYTAKLNTECSCTSFVDIPASNTIPANSRVLAFTGSAPDAKFTTTSLAGKTVYVIYADDASGCSSSGKYGNSCASNCTRYLTIFNHQDGDIDNESFTTPGSTSGGDIWDFQANKVVSLGCSLTILPIDLLYFNATYNPASNVVNIDWATASETNNKLFTVQKSTNGIDWQDLTDLPGAGNSTSNLYYSAIDENPTKGVSYYRLLQTDFDGLFKTSGSVAVNIDVESKNLVITPNPVNRTVTVSFNSVTGGISNIGISDLTGRIVGNEQVSMSKGANTFTLNTSTYPNGMYYVMVNNGLTQLSSKFVVNHNVH